MDLKLLGKNSDLIAAQNFFSHLTNNDMLKIEVTFEKNSDFIGKGRNVYSFSKPQWKCKESHMVSILWKTVKDVPLKLYKHNSSIICFKWSQLGAHYFLVYVFQLLYMFPATMFPSPAEHTASMRRWYFSQSENYQRRIDTVSSAGDGPIVARNM